MTITTASPSGYTAGETVTISAIGTAGYNGTFTIVSVSGTTFTYLDANTGLANDTNGGFAQTGFTLTVAGTSTIAAATESGTTVTITTAAAETFAAGQIVTVAGVGVSGYNGSWAIVSIIDNTDFTYVDSNSGLGNSSGGTVGVGELPTVSYSSPDGGLTWIVTYTGTGVAGGSIASGVYNLTLNPSAVTFLNSGATLALNNRGTDTFFREYGDITGDGVVNNSDNLQFKKTYLDSTGSTTYLAALDYNGDGTVNNTDNLQFKKNYLVSLSGFSATI